MSSLALVALRPECAQNDHQWASLMDEIRFWCARLQSTVPAEHALAYGWLLSSEPFMAVVKHLNRQHLSFHEVAGLLAQRAEGAMAEHTWRLLKAATQPIEPGDGQAPADARMA